MSSFAVFLAGFGGMLAFGYILRWFMRGPK